MTSTSMTPDSRPRRVVAAALAVAVGVALVVAVVVAGPADEAAAAELEAFSSCEELAEWGDLSRQGGSSGSEDRFTAVGSEVSEEGSDVAAQESAGMSDDALVAASEGEAAGAPATTTAGSPDDASGSSADEGDGGGDDGDTTNVAVEGVDELDLIDRLDDDVYLVATSERLAIVDLEAAEVRASTAVPHDAQVTFDRDRGIAWVVGHGVEGGVVVERIAVAPSELTPDARWTTSGRLVDARRVGGSLHLVATEGFPVAVPGGSEPVPGPAVDGPPLTGTIVDEGVAEDPVPEPGFEGGDGAVAPPSTTEPAPTETTVAPDPAATVEPAEPAVPETTIPEPETSVPTTAGPDITEPEITEPEITEPEITEPETTEPRPTTEPATTEPVEPEPGVPFPGGPVPCDEVLHPIGPSSPEATLLVTLPATGELAPTHAAEVVGAGSQVHVTLDAAYLATALHEGEPATSIHRFDLATLTHTGSGRVEGGLLDEFSMSEHAGYLRVAVTTGFESFGTMGVTEEVGAPVPVEGDAPVAAEESDEGAAASDAQPPGRNEIVVLDTEGDLDVVGRTARFGKPGEAIHGIRFTGEVAYAVTFLETDPFYVVDLSDPAAPEVVGEVELPGFSAYLHPLSPSLVVGFGPGADGRAKATLFDVSDPTAPRVADDVVLGDESAVVWDHHAFVDLGDGRFAVPATTWAGPMVNDVVVLDGSSGMLEEVERVGTSPDDDFEPAQRAIPTSDGWALLVWDRIEVLDGAGGASATIPLR